MSKWLKIRVVGDPFEYWVEIKKNLAYVSEPGSLGAGPTLRVFLKGRLVGEYVNVKRWAVTSSDEGDAPADGDGE